MKLSDLQTIANDERARRDELYRRITETNIKRNTLADWLAAITPDTPIDEIAKSESEHVALARVIKTLRTMAESADNDYQRALKEIEYWTQRAEGLAKDAKNTRRSVEQAQQAIVEAEGRVIVMTRRKQELILEAEELEQERGNIMSE